ncbi:MAG: hypothetical protein HOE90_13915 [Bacteriovoracaceae bacterium]|nr:hypothetical protein [Bacteriovoracaceae bacterium]
MNSHISLFSCFLQNHLYQLTPTIGKTLTITDSPNRLKENSGVDQILYIKTVVVSKLEALISQGEFELVIVENIHAQLLSLKGREIIFLLSSLKISTWATIYPCENLIKKTTHFLNHGFQKVIYYKSSSKQMRGHWFSMTRQLDKWFFELILKKENQGVFICDPSGSAVEADCRKSRGAPANIYKSSAPLMETQSASGYRTVVTITCCEDCYGVNTRKYKREFMDLIYFLKLLFWNL